MSGWAGVEGYQPDVKEGSGNPEALKYGKLWNMPEYREYSPGEQHVPVFLEQAKPKPASQVIDFGCGSGRAGLMLAVLGGLRVTFVDFIRNCLDEDIEKALTTQPDVLRFVKDKKRIGY